jgi:diguanylate cyclase (GGDEF)-like protein
VTDTLKYQVLTTRSPGLLNRNELALRMNATLSKCMSVPVPSYAIFIDIDHFRVINDSCGTQAGDPVLLVETVNRIRTEMGPSDYAARLRRRRIFVPRAHTDENGENAERGP